MMNPIYKLTGLVIFLFAVLLAFNHVADEDPLLTEQSSSEHEVDDDDDAGNSSVDTIKGIAAVYMNMETQQQANIRTIQLESAEHQDEIRAYARVLDISQLLDWWSRYRAVQTEIRSVETAVQVSRQEFDRLQLLRSEASNISERQLQQARLQLVNDQASMNAVQNKLKDIRIQLIQAWGNALADKLINDEDFARQLFERKTLLLLVVLEGNNDLPDNTDIIFINEQGRDRTQATEASYISPASFPDNRIYGKTYLFHTHDESLRMGVYLDAWIPKASDSIFGVFIPPEAVIWYADRPWVYIKANDETFQRRDIDKYTVTRSGWFVQEGFEDGELLVLHGAQMLFSEEFRWSIPDEDDDP